MEPFEITVELMSPVVLGKDTFWTLDAVCYGILSEMAAAGLTGIDPVSGIPIECDNGLFLASMAFFRSDVRSDFTKIGSIRVVKDMQDASSFIDPRRKRMSKVVTTRGDQKAHLSRYVEIAARSVSWIADGDPDKVSALLRNAGAIGALTKDGYGRIGEISIDTDPDLDPVANGQTPIRPIPADHPAATRLDPSWPKIEDTWRPPYFDRTRAAVCFVPSR